MTNSITSAIPSVSPVIRARWVDDEIAIQARRDAYRQADTVLAVYRDKLARKENELETAYKVISCFGMAAIVSIVCFVL